MAMDDRQVLEALLPSKNKEGRKLRKEDENVTVDNQFNRIYPLGVLLHCQLTRCRRVP